MTEDEIEEEAGFIKNRGMWPMWPLLPVKNIHRGEDDFPHAEGVGMILGDNLTTVHLYNLYALKAGVPVQDQIAECEKLTFNSVEDMVRAGWIGD